MNADRFKRLAQQFDALAENLQSCTAPPQRGELLRRMRIVIGEIDQLLLQEHSHPDSEQDGTAPPTSQ